MCAARSVPYHGNDRNDDYHRVCVFVVFFHVLFLFMFSSLFHTSTRFTEDSMSFTGVGKPEGKKYELNVEFFSKINPDKVASKNIKRCIEFVIAKAEPQETYWPRLLKDKTKPHWLKVDFNRWEDEGSNDEEGGGK